MEEVIRVVNFRKNFGDKVTHRNVSFQVRRGECLGLLGGSGAGKSVILRSLIGLEKPDGGSIFVDGDEISRWNEMELIEIRKKVAYVFQNGALFDSMDVFDNLAYPLREHTDFSESQIAERIEGLLEEFGLAGTEKLYPAELSGGMQKRVGLARSIILGPKVVLYDEPTAGLDPYNTLMIQELILKLQSKGVSSVFVTHDMPSAFAVCDRIALLQHGEIAAIGTKRDMEADSDGLLKRFISGQKI